MDGFTQLSSFVDCICPTISFELKSSVTVKFCQDLYDIFYVMDDKEFD